MLYLTLTVICDVDGCRKSTRMPQMVKNITAELAKRGWSCRAVATEESNPKHLCPAHNGVDSSNLRFKANHEPDQPGKPQGS